MCEEALIRRVAGLFIMASVALGVLVHPGWLAFTAFVGAQTGAEVQYVGSGNSLSAQIRGVYKTASRFDGEVQGTVSTPAGVCWLPTTKVVLNS